MNEGLAAVWVGILGAVLVAVTGCGSIATIREPAAGERLTVIVQKEAIGSDPQQPFPK